MKHVTILILTTKTDLQIMNQTDILTLHQPILLVDDFNINHNQESLSFDYLIVLNQDLVKNIDMLPFYKDKEVILTNFYQQSSIEHIYYINERDLMIDQKIESAINHICYGD